MVQTGAVHAARCLRGRSPTDIWLKSAISVPQQILDTDRTGDVQFSISTEIGARDRVRLGHHPQRSRDRRSEGAIAIAQQYVDMCYPRASVANRPIAAAG